MKDRPSDRSHPAGSPFGSESPSPAAPGPPLHPQGEPPLEMKGYKPGIQFSRPCGAHVVIRCRPQRPGFMLDWKPCSNGHCEACARVSTVLNSIYELARGG